MGWYSLVHEVMEGRVSTQELCAQPGGLERFPIRRREGLSQTKGRWDSPEELRGQCL